MTNERNDGGPAFPTEATSWEDANNNTHDSGGDPGMSLRDWFAGQAIAGRALQPWLKEYAVAELAYKLADEMLKARDQ